jgi:very-short-patch-repair endonuclease
MNAESLENFHTFVSKFAYRSGSDNPPSAISRLRIEEAPKSRSIGEALVQKILEKDLGLRYKHDYLTEHCFVDMQRRLRFDFFLVKHRLLIEFDGDQHYSGSKYHRTRAEWIEAIERDEIKNNYCIEKNLSLIRIPQVYSQHPGKLKTLILEFVSQVENSPQAIINVDLYFQLKSGKISL